MLGAGAVAIGESNSKQNVNSDGKQNGSADFAFSGGHEKADKSDGVQVAVAEPKEAELNTLHITPDECATISATSEAQGGTSQFEVATKVAGAFSGKNESNGEKADAGGDVEPEKAQTAMHDDPSESHHNEAADQTEQNTMLPASRTTTRKTSRRSKS